MAYLDPDLPDELQGGQTRPSGQPKADPAELLNSLSTVVAMMRDEAVVARRASGIEEVWLQCEEAYLGIDDANRHEFARARWAKPTSMSGPVTTNDPPKNNTRSTAFVRLTSRYVDMGAAKISEITLPIDDKAFALTPTPVPDLVNAMKDKTPVTNAQGKTMMRPLAEGEPAPESPPAPGHVVATKGDLARITMDQAKDSADKAEQRLYDWMSEAKYPAEMRKVVHDSARIGAGVLKCPFPKITTSFARENKRLKKKTKLAPGMKWVSTWNLYPDESCGEDIHNGDGVFECDKITAAKLRKLKEEILPDGKPIYIHNQIDKVLAEGPDKSNLDTGNPNEQLNLAKKQPFKIWYYTGVIKRDDMRTMNAVGVDELPDEVVDVNAIVTLVNDSVIRATVNPLESGHFPYRVLCWSRRDGHWAGVGVAEQVAMPQRAVNAATRALFNNAGITAGGQIVMDRSQIEPADGTWAIVPNKIWWTKTGSTIEDIRKIFMSFEFPNMGPQLQAVIDYGFRLAEESSNIPLVTQGRESENTPQTFGAAELQNSNAHTLLRSIAYALDDNITEPVVTDLYEWLLLDDEVPEEEKGDFVINAHGSIVMVEKAIQEMVLAQLLPLSKDPAYGLNPMKVAEDYVRGKRLDPRRIQYTEEELAEMARRPPPEDSIITAAKIRADAQVKTSAGHDQATVAKSKADTDRDTIYNNVMAQRSANEHTATMAELQLRERLALLDYANKRDLTLDEVKAKLAETAMKLNVQKELSREAMNVDLHKHRNPPPVMKPPTEPAGRAKPGRAFQA